MSLWANITSTPYNWLTGIVAIGFALVLLLLQIWVKKEIKLANHLLILVTFILLVGLGIAPLKNTLSEGNHLGAARVIIMMLSCSVALVFFILNLIKSKKV